MKTPGKRSSRGSHATWSEGDNRTCLHCGQTLRISVDPAIWIHTENGEHTSSHAACGPPWKEPPPSAPSGKAPANHRSQEPR